ncbi:MAG TPA: DUF1223 domain-containing protein [Polyangia bacterium]|jgi:hypothetical protein|nr:DUF1223 domain-containing protein [Polyangia bacterium]
MRLTRCLGVWLAGLFAACSTPVLGAAPAPARVVLVELFTSQGCSSCPAADAFVAQLPSLGYGHDRVLPLTFHVDYWDDLGWKDPFASPAFTERQRRYARQGGLRSPESTHGEPLTGVYTPQMIVDGTVHFSGGRRSVALAEIQRAATATPLFDLSGTATIDSDRATITVRAAPAAAPPGRAAKLADWQLSVALLARRARTAVTRGENRGETLDEAAIVRALSEPVPLPSTSAGTRIQLSKPSSLSWTDIELVAFAQATATLHIGGAAAVVIAR